MAIFVPDAIIRAPAADGRHHLTETIYVTNGLNGGGAERLLTNLLLQQSDRDRIVVISLSPGGIFVRRWRTPAYTSSTSA